MLVGLLHDQLQDCAADKTHGGKSAAMAMTSSRKATTISAGKRARAVESESGRDVAKDNNKAKSKKAKGELPMCTLLVVQH